MKLEDIKVGEIYIIRNSKAEVLAIKNQKVVYWDIADQVSGDIHITDVYPIKTPAETLREETIKAAENTCYRSEGFTFCEALYDAGMLVKPCQPCRKIGFDKFCEIGDQSMKQFYEALKPYMNTED